MSTSPTDSNSESAAAGTFTSRDLWLSASLIAHGLELIRVESASRKPHEAAGPAWALFVLRDQPDRQRLVQQYLAGELACNVVKLRAALGVLRDQMRLAPGSGQRGV